MNSSIYPCLSLSSPPYCANFGWCIGGSNGQYSCMCHAGVKGANCSIQVLNSAGNSSYAAHQYVWGSLLCCCAVLVCIFFVESFVAQRKKSFNPRVLQTRRCGLASTFLYCISLAIFFFLGPDNASSFASLSITTALAVMLNLCLSFILISALVLALIWIEIASSLNMRIRNALDALQVAAIIMSGVFVTIAIALGIASPYAVWATPLFFVAAAIIIVAVAATVVTSGIIVLWRLHKGSKIIASASTAHDRRKRKVGIWIIMVFCLGVAGLVFLALIGVLSSSEQITPESLLAIQATTGFVTVVLGVAFALFFRIPSTSAKSSSSEGSGGTTTTTNVNNSIPQLTLSKDTMSGVIEI